MNITAVAVSLYFVFDLDDKIMDSDPKLRPRYRSIVAKMTAEQAPNCFSKAIKQASALTIYGLHCCTSLGLVLIVILSWKQQPEYVRKGEWPVVIGGDPFRQHQGTPAPPHL